MRGRAQADLLSIFILFAHTRSVREEIAEMGDSQTASLCNACRNITIESLSAPSGYRHVTLGVLSKSSCRLCKLIDDGRIHNYNRDRETPIQLGVMEKASRMGAVEAYLSITVGEKKDMTYTSIVTSSGSPAAIDFGIPTFRELTSTGSSSTLDVAKGWIQHCLAKHDCSESLFRSSGEKLYRDDEKTNVLSPLLAGIGLKSNHYPTRLLDINAFEPACPDLRLIEAPIPGPSYATLSHC